MADQHSSVEHLAKVRSEPGTDGKEISIMSATRNAVAGWDFSRWFAVLSPLVGVFLLAYFALH